MYSRALISVLGLLMVNAAHGQTIYKCPLPDGQYAYTDRPCAGPGAQVVRMPKENAHSGKLSDLSLGELSSRVTELHQRRRKLGDAQQRDSDQASWLPSIQAIDDQIEALQQEIRRRCPNGSVLNAKSKSCGKKIGRIMTVDPGP